MTENVTNFQNNSSQRQVDIALEKQEEASRQRLHNTGKGFAKGTIKTAAMVGGLVAAPGMALAAGVKKIHDKNKEHLDELSESNDQQNEKTETDSYDSMPKGKTGSLGSSGAGLSSIAPGKNGGASITIDGHNINLQPGTSVTIGKDGSVKFSNAQLDPASVQASQHPFDHTIDQTGYARQYGDQMNQYNTNLQNNPNDPNAAYQQAFNNQNQGNFPTQAFQNSEQMKRDYADKGYNQTAAGIGKNQESAVKGEMAKEQQNTKNKSLQTNGPEVSA